MEMIIPWNKGAKSPKHSQEMIGNNFRKGNKGHKMSMLSRNKMSVSKMGELNPMKRKEVRDLFKGEKHPMFGKGYKLEGDKNGRWLGGVSFEKYPKEFCSELKLAIRKRDKFICQLCGIDEKQSIKKYKGFLCINHIDYDKHNCHPSNLNTLCRSCNAIVNGNRKMWTKLFRDKMKRSELILGGKIKETRRKY